jgi:hypothetical protein
MPTNNLIKFVIFAYRKRVTAIQVASLIRIGKDEGSDV